MSDETKFLGVRVKPITEGYEVKGGQNTSIPLITRPPPPAPIRMSEGNNQPHPTTENKSG